MGKPETEEAGAAEAGKTEAKTEDGGVEAPQEPDASDMGEFINAYREEATPHVEKLKKLSQLNDNPKDKGLISEILLSLKELKNISTAMGLANISGLSGSLEGVFSKYAKNGEVEEKQFGSIKQAVDKLVELHSDLENSDKAELDELIQSLKAAA